MSVLKKDKSEVISYVASHSPRVWDPRKGTELLSGCVRERRITCFVEKNSETRFRAHNNGSVIC